MILKQSRDDDDADAAWVRVALDPVHGSGKAASATQQRIAGRLAVLSHMGLATSDGTGGWRVKQDFEAVLRAMQRVADRQKMLATHGVLMSDERLPIEILDRRKLTSVEGRVLVHGEDENSGRSYLMLEGTNAKVHFVYYTPEIEEDVAAIELAGGNLAIELKRVDTGRAAEIEALDPASYDHVLVLGYGDHMEPQPADTRTLVTLLHLRKVSEAKGGAMSVVSEMIDVRNRALAEVTKVDDFVVSNKLVSLMLSQVSENKQLNAVVQSDAFKARVGALGMTVPADNTPATRAHVLADIIM